MSQPRGRGAGRGQRGRGAGSQQPSGRGGFPSRGGPPGGGQQPGATRGRGTGPPPPHAPGGGYQPGGPPRPPPSGPSAVQPTPTEVSLAKHVKAEGVKRPGFGKRGNAIALHVNCFPAKIPEGTIYQYDVDFSPQAGSKPLKMELFQKILALPEFAAASNSTKGVYDSDKQFFSTVSLGDACQFQLPDGRKTYIVKMKLVAEINPQVLHEYVQGKATREDHITTVLSACNVAIRMGLIERYPLYNRNSFFIREAEVRGFRDKKYDGLEMWRGFFQSIRPVMGQMIINVDVSTGVVVKGGPMLVIALQFFRQPPNNPQFLLTLRPRDQDDLKRFLRGMKFVTKDAPGARPSAVKTLGQSADRYTFNLDTGESITVAEYNRRKGTPLTYPKLPCVEKIGASTSVFPIEHCKVIPQLLVEPDQINDVLGFSTMKPNVRLQKIREGFQFLQYGQNEYLRDFGIAIDPNPLKLQARVLPAPELQYKGRVERPQGGVWKTGRFFDAKEVKGWVIIVLDTNTMKQPETMRFAQELRDTCMQQGMSWTNNPPVVLPKNPMSDPEACIKEGLIEHRKRGVDANLVIIIIPEEGKELYNRIKYIGDVKLGITTQCLKASKTVKSNRQYCSNVSLKINAKLGGTNVVLKQTDAKFLAEEATLVLGADVMHSRAMGEEGLGRPSFAAVSGNVDAAASRYVGVSSAQRTRTEMIADLEGMVLQIIGEYKKANPGKRPFTRVLYFRDGVAENQFQTVVKEEIPQIRNACFKAGIKGGVKVTCVIVGKRHHVRLFPAGESAADKTGNAHPGTVIDSVITSPVEFDFYLQPHAGLLGTSRPIHCNVLVDDNLFTPDDLQQLTFNLCHIYARSTRSVSLPASVYYAHLICARANHRYDPNGDFSLERPAPRGMTKEQAEEWLQRYIDAFLPLHGKTQSLMYFQ